MRVEKTVFISYRRTNQYHAQAVYLALKNAGFDAFIDFQSIDSGAFDQVILNQIAARAHFVVILTPSALERCDDPDDWLRREIEHAIDLKRNIIPLLFDQFDFAPVRQYLTGKLSVLSTYNGVAVPTGYFDEAMQRLITRFLNVPLDAVLHPIPPEDRVAVQQRKAHADALPEPSAAQMSEEQCFERANKLRQEGDNEQAIEYYTEAIRLQPNYIAAYINRGLARFSLGDHDGAIADYSEAIRLKPDYAYPYYYRGLARHQQGDYDGAVADYTEVIRLGAGDGPPYINRGLARSRLGDHNGSVADYTKAIRLKPDDALAYNNRGYAYAILGDLKKALKDCNKALELDPLFASAYDSRGYVYELLGDLDEAVSDYEMALTIESDLQESIDGLERIRQRKREQDS